MRSLLAVLAACVVLAGCTDAPAPEPERSATPSAVPSGSAKGCGQVPDDVTGGVRDVERTIDVDGSERSYVVHVPPGYDGREALPVVYLFHGLGGTAAEVVTYSGFSNAADDRGFVLVAPQAQGDRKEWDVMATAEQPRSDAAFWLELTQRLGDEWCIDGDRQYAAGMSNGSAVVFAMACRGVYPIKAYGAVAATFYDRAACGDSPPASIVYFHGTADQVVPFDGGPTPIFPVRGVRAVMADWAAHDGCASRPRTTDVAADVQLERWTGCDDGARLESYVIDGGGHTWPGAAVDIPPLGATTRSVSATEVISDFFDL